LEWDSCIYTKVGLEWDSCLENVADLGGAVSWYGERPSCGWLTGNAVH